MAETIKARLNVYVMPELKEYAVKESTDLGMSLSAYVSMLIAERRRMQRTVESLPEMLEKIKDIQDMAKLMDKKE